VGNSSFKHVTYAVARRIVVATVGATLVVLGLVLVFTPGPAVVVLALALAVFAAEFTWARRWLKKLKRTVNLADSDPETGTTGRMERGREQRDA
jgi:hypothetical protein